MSVRWRWPRSWRRLTQICTPRSRSFRLPRRPPRPFPPRSHAMGVVALVGRYLRIGSPVNLPGPCRLYVSTIATQTFHPRNGDQLLAHFAHTRPEIKPAVPAGESSQGQCPRTFLYCYTYHGRQRSRRRGAVDLVTSGHAWSGAASPVIVHRPKDRGLGVDDACFVDQHPRQERRSAR